MEDGGRGAHARAAAPAAAKKKKKEEKNGANTLREQPRHPGPFAQIPDISDALREHLEALGATEPTFMIAKSLAMSDVNREQARLLFSCKRESPSQFTSAFTETEMQFVEDETGLLVTAFDRGGRSYDLTCKYLVSNTGYRFITGWKAYVNDNGLGVGMRVELWCFWSPKLHNQYELRLREGKEEKVKVPVTVEIGHPDGALGLVLLQYEKNDLLEPEQVAVVEPDEAPPVQETENGLELEQAAVDKPNEAPLVQETETRHKESKTLTTAGRECAESPIKKRNIVISREKVFDAAIGLLELKKRYGGGGGGRR